MALLKAAKIDGSDSDPIMCHHHYVTFPWSSVCIISYWEAVAATSCWGWNFERSKLPICQGLESRGYGRIMQNTPKIHPKITSKYLVLNLKVSVCNHFFSNAWISAAFLQHPWISHCTLLAPYFRSNQDLKQMQQPKPILCSWTLLDTTWVGPILIILHHRHHNPTKFNIWSDDTPSRMMPNGNHALSSSLDAKK